MNASIAPVASIQREPATEVVEITPELAEEWLGKNVQNRNVRRGKVALYARKMRDGVWSVTNQGIGFDTGGTLVDGQHRLHAVIEAGIPVRMNVTKGLDPKARSHIDTGAARTAGDILSVNHGIKNASLTAAIAKRAVAWDKGFRWLSNYNVSPEEIEQYVLDHPDISRAAEVAASGTKYIACPPSIIGTGYYLASRRSRAAADMFFVEQLIEGIGLQTNDPARVLSKWLTGDAQFKGTTAEFRKLAFIFHAWNKFRAGAKVTKLNAPKGTGWNDDNYPEPK